MCLVTKSEHNTTSKRIYQQNMRKKRTKNNNKEHNRKESKIDLNIFTQYSVSPCVFPLKACCVFPLRIPFCVCVMFHRF